MSSNDRIDDFERRLRALELELAELRRLAVVAAPPEEPVVEVPAVRATEPVTPTPSAPIPLAEPDGAWEAAQPAERWYERSYDLNDIRAADLLGARALAWAGGIVFLLGIVLFFALAVNRGWIGPGARVVLAACASGIVFAGGLFLRRRFGETYAALAAVGAGIAGAYATLLAAGPYYDLIPDPVALALAAVVAGVALFLALLWESEILAGIGLIGALAVPVPIAWGDGVTTTGTGFVAVMFLVAAIVAVVRRWEVLLTLATIVVVPQVIALAAQHEGEAAAGPLVAALACSGVLLASGIALHLRGGRELAPFHATLALVAAVLAGGSVVILLETRTSEGYALLAIAGVFAAAAAPLYRAGRRDLGLFLFAIALAAAAVAGADLLSGASLGVVWAAEAAVLGWLAGRIRDLRVQLAALAYLVLALIHVLAIDTPLSHLFVERLDPASGVLALVATSIGLAFVAFRCGGEWADAPGGVFGAIRPLLETMRASQRELRFALGLAGGLTATYAASLGLLELPGGFEWNQVAVTYLYVLVPLVVLIVGLLRPSRELQLAAAIGFGLATLKNIGFDLTQLEPPQRAWTMVGVGSALLAAGFLVHVLNRELTDLDRAGSIVVVLTAGYAIAAPIDLLDGRWTGAGQLVAAGIYAALSAAVFRVERLRDFATVLWAEALGVYFVAVGFLLDGTAAAGALAGAGILLVALVRLLREVRFQYGAAVCVLLASLHALVFDAPPSHLFESSAHPASGAGAVAAAALGALALALVADVPKQLGGSSTPLFALAGALGLYAVSLVVLELFQLADNKVETDFERGHAAVSALYGLLALVLLYLGLTRRLSLRVAGFFLFGITLAKIFLYDLATLSPVARALSFLAVGAVLLLGGFFYQRLSSDAARRREAPGR